MNLLANSNTSSESIATCFKLKKTLLVGDSVVLNPQPCTLFSVYANNLQDSSSNKPSLEQNLLSFTNSIYLRMHVEQQDQSIFFNGLSGSGKSSSRKLVVNHLIAISPKKQKVSKVLSSIEKMESVLEAFGHAKSDHSLNSSKFSRYTEMQYNQKGKLIGCKTVEYALAKNHLISLVDRNFHIFYLLLAGATQEEKAFWRLSDPSSFHYLSKSSLSPNDSVQADLLRDNLKSVGIGRRTQSEIFNLIAAILHLGNIQFQEPSSSSDACNVKNHADLDFVADLLGIDARDLELSLTYQTRLIKREVCTLVMNVAGAIKQRDSFATTLYSLLFSWIIERLNTRLCRDECHTFIALVDFSSNSSDFQGLLNSFAIERLSNFQTLQLIDNSINELKSDGILSEKTNIPRYSSNYPQIEFSLELLNLINTESATASQSSILDLNLLDKLNDSFQNSKFFKSTKKQSKFTIQHYFGTVEYDCTSFVDSNIDALCPDFISLCKGDTQKEMKESEDPLVRELFSDKLVATRKHWNNNNVTIATRALSRRPSVKKVKNVVTDDDRLLNTVATCFVSSLDELCATLEQTVMWHVYCFLENQNLKNDSIDESFIALQLDSFNIPAIARSRILCSDYTVNMSFRDFIERFESIIVQVSSIQSASDLDIISDFCESSGWSISDYTISRKSSVIYLSDSCYRILVDEMKENQQRELFDRKGAFLFGDQESIFSDNEVFSELASNYDSDVQSIVNLERKNTRRENFDAENPIDREHLIDEQKSSPSRRKWVCFSWLLTFWIPGFFLSWCGGMKRKDIQMAWREKVALCFLIFTMCCSLLFLIIGAGRLICPQQAVLSTFEINSKNTIDDVWVYAYGRAYQINSLVQDHLTSYNVPKYQWEPFLGSDVSQLFYKVSLWDLYCPGIEKPLPSNWDNLVTRRPNSTQFYPHASLDPITKTQKLYLEYMNQYAKARIVWDMEYIKKISSQEKKILVIYGNVYDVSSYFSSTNKPFGPDFTALFSSFVGQDASSNFNSLKKKSVLGPAYADKVLKCMDSMFYIGTIDTRTSIQCLLSNYVLLAASLVIFAVILVKFLSALQFGSNSLPEEHDKFVIMQVPCYTEGVESLTKSLESLATMKYDDKRKLIFVVCDGMIIGSGNDRPTPRIVLDILGVDPNIDPEPLAFQSLGEGDKQLNFGKVYSGLYEIQGRSVPFIVVVKVGKPTERQRPGNRGKRDSQMLLMRFLNRVHFNSEMAPLELELFHQLKNVIGVSPSFYEYVLMVDADTSVYSDALNKMISTMIHDSKIVGLCGETLISNAKDSMTTMIQVYEYFISHHLSKAFESLFGSVTCLPGCFCMYRIRNPQNVPLLISNNVVGDYSENVVDTLHMKNLLHLGEDRYLTTLMMKHFPQSKLVFTNEAKCETNAPDRWPVLLSQRRRWINSTVHNLLELMFLPELCGFCCFSMRFVVFLDLFSTIVQPAAVLYIGYLVYVIISASTSSALSQNFPLISLIMLAGIYGLQVIIFLIKKQWAQIGWMIVYLLAIPVFSFYIPVYSFWHFDDFSWGNTRVVLDSGKKLVYAPDVKAFDPNSIILRKWSENASSEKEDSIKSYRSELPPHYASSVKSAGVTRYSIPSNYTPSIMSVTQRPQPVYEHNTPSIPSDDELVFEIKRILSTSDLMAITKKKVREELQVVFKTDLSFKRDFINAAIAEYLSTRS